MCSFKPPDYMKSYSQLRATLAITRASLRAILRSPSTVVFSLGFPLIFILVFGFLGSGKSVSLKVAMDPASDSVNIVYQSIRDLNALSFVQKDSVQVLEDLEKGRLTAIIKIEQNSDSVPAFLIKLRTSDAVNPQDLQVLRTVLEGKIGALNTVLYPHRPTIAAVEDHVERIHGRIYRTIDFILPGQLGFSLLSAGVFGVAFLFISLRQTLVLKRFFATPVSRASILVGEGLSRLIFQITTAIIILLAGHFFFQFTLVNGWITFIELLVLSVIGLFVSLGLGFVVSGLARNEAAVPPIANLITLPQFLLAGTFFPIESFPTWLQPICKIMPLTHLNNAMRNVAFEGAHLTDCGTEIGILAIWIIVAYGAAVKVFRWE